MRTGFMIALFVFSITVPAFSQIVAEWQLLPQTDGDNLTVPFDKTNATVNDFKISVGLPIVLSTSESNGKKEPSLVLTNSIFYGRKYLDVNNWPLYTLDDEQNYGLNLLNTNDHLISFGYSAMLTKKFSEKWSLIGIGGFVYAGVSPDKYKIEDMGITGGFAALRTWESKWSLGLGLYYSRLTGADAVLPLIIIQKQTEKSMLDISLPSQLSYWYHLNKKASLGVLAQLDGDMYTFVGEKTNQYDDAGQLESTDNKVGLAYSAFTIGPAMKLSVFSGVALIVRAGMSLSRRYQYWLPEKKEVLRYNASPDYLTLTGHDYSGEKVDFPMKQTGFIKLTLGFGM